MRRAIGVIVGLGVTAIVGNAIADLGFEERVLYGVPGSPFRVAVGNFDGDAFTDVAAPGWFTNDVKILFGDGTGDFGDAVSFDAGAGPVHVAVADLDGGNGDDLVVSGAPLRVLLNDGTGNFTGTDLAVSSGTNSVIADFDGVNGPDLAVVASGDEVAILLNDGAGGFAPGGSFPALDSLNDPSVVWVASANMDGDDDQDIVVSTSGGGVRVYKNDGSGNFSFFTHADVAAGAFTVSLADFNGDDSVDVAVSNQFSGGSAGGAIVSLSILLNDGQGNLNTLRTIGDTIRTHVVAQDLDADGDADLAVADPAGFAEVYVNDGAGNFAEPLARETGLTTGVTQGIAVADFNADGAIDLVTANWTQNAVAVLLGSTSPGPGGGPGPADDVQFAPATISSRALQSVEVSGTGFVDGATVNFRDGIRVDSVTFNSETSLTAVIEVQNPFGSALREVTVRNPDGQSISGTLTFQSLDLQVQSGKLKDSARAGRDRLRVRGISPTTDLSKQVVTQFDPRFPARTIRIGDGTDAWVLEIPASDRGWRVRRNGRAVWTSKRSDRDDRRRIKLTLQTDGTFALSASRVDLAFELTEDITVELEVEATGSVDSGAETRTWTRRRPDTIKLP